MRQNQADGKHPVLAQDIFESVIERHFRIVLPDPPELYIRKTLEMPYEERFRTARTTRFPQLLIALAGDPDVQVRNAAHGTWFWQYIGQCRTLLDMSRKDKLLFAEQEDILSIMVFFMLESDPAVLRAGLSNPAVSVHMLGTYRQCVLARPGGSNDEELLQDLAAAIRLKRERIFKVADIWREQEGLSSEGVQATLGYLLDGDDTVVRSALNRLDLLSEDQLMRHLAGPAPLGNEADPAVFWQVLQALKRLYRLPGTAGCYPERQQAVVDELTGRQAALLADCAVHLHSQAHFLTLVTAYNDGNPELRSIAMKHLPPADLIDFLSDPSCPQSLAYNALELLNDHPDTHLRKQLAAISLLLAERSRQRLQDMENSLKAAFDVLDGWENGLLKAILSEGEIPLKELHFLREVLTQIRTLPQDLRNSEGLSELEGDERSARQIQGIQLLWRATIGQYLERLKTLTDIVRNLYQLAQPAGTNITVFRGDMEQHTRNLEKVYKQEVKCQLHIRCIKCMKRTCAARRFLTELTFFTDELLLTIQAEKNNRSATRTGYKKTSDEEVVF